MPETDTRPARRIVSTYLLAIAVAAVGIGTR